MVCKIFPCEVYQLQVQLSFDTSLPSFSLIFDIFLIFSIFIITLFFFLFSGCIALVLFSINLTKLSSSSFVTMDECSFSPCTTSSFNLPVIVLWSFFKGNFPDQKAFFLCNKLDSKCSLALTKSCSLYTILYMLCLLNSKMWWTLL